MGKVEGNFWSNASFGWMKEKESLREQSCPRLHGLILSFSCCQRSLPGLPLAFSSARYVEGGRWCVWRGRGGKCRAKRHSVSPGLGFLTWWVELETPWFKASNTRRVYDSRSFRILLGNQRITHKSTGNHTNLDHIITRQSWVIAEWTNRQWVLLMFSEGRGSYSPGRHPRKYLSWYSRMSRH